MDNDIPHTPRSANPYAIQSFDQLRVIHPDVKNALANKQTMLHFNLAPRRGGWTQTFTGQQFWPMDPRPEEVHLEDIAHALANLCRYNGHTSSHYSVAEHCVLLSQVVSEENALWALLHDATEAYIGDMVRPLKNFMPDYVAVEEALMGVIATRFGLVGPMPDEVKEADSRIILNERAALLGPPPADWGLSHLAPLDLDIRAWGPAGAKAEYLARFTRLSALTSTTTPSAPVAD